jgi:AraC-like DNA-binding protein
MDLFDGLAVVSGEISGLSARRRRALLADGHDDLVLTTHRSGHSISSQLGRECRADAGTSVLLSHTEPGAQHFPERAGYLILRIPPSRLSGLVAGTPEDVVVRPIPASTEALRLLVDYVEASLRQPLESPQLVHLFTSHVHDLVALAIGAARDAAEVVRGRGLRAARLNAAKGNIMRCLADEGLSVIDVATRLGVTPRYVQRLFESEGTTFSQYVTHQRLVRAYRLLSDPRFLDRTITAIAFEVGFGSISHFNRGFRRSYGAAPSDIRASALRAADSK